MDADTDIKKLRKLLILSKEEGLSLILSGCTSYLDESSTFGSRSWSRLSNFQISAPLAQLHKLKGLSKKDQLILKNHVKMIYPTRDNAPEINEIEYLPHLDSLDDLDLVAPEKLIELNLDFVSEQINKCKDKIINGDYDGAITNARSLLESICIHIIERTFGEIIKPDGDLPALYKQATSALKMESSLYDNKELKKLISGSFSMVTGIAALRNSLSDSHGKSSASSYKIPKHHAILIVNLSKSLSEFLISSLEYRNSNH